MKVEQRKGLRTLSALIALVFVITLLALPVGALPQTEDETATIKLKEGELLISQVPSFSFKMDVEGFKIPGGRYRQAQSAEGEISGDIFIADGRGQKSDWELTVSMDRLEPASGPWLRDYTLYLSAPTFRPDGIATKGDGTPIQDTREAFQGRPVVLEAGTGAKTIARASGDNQVGGAWRGTIPKATIVVQPAYPDSVTHSAVMNWQFRNAP